MPTYDYECLDCGDTFEKFQSITARPVRKCPSCRTGKVRRLIGAGAGLIFRGSGFYITDYRSDEYKKKAKAEKGSAGSSASSDKSDSSSKSDSSGSGGSTKESSGKNASTPKS